MSLASLALPILRAFLARPSLVASQLWGPHNVKVLAYEIARRRAEECVAAGPAGREPAPAGLTSLVCSSAHWSTDWLPYWTQAIGMQPALHRKLWEFAYIAQVLRDAGMLRPGVAGLGFGCGREPLASLFVARGCAITATDLAASAAAAAGWSAADQHAASLAGVWMPELCSRADAEARLRFREVDMTRIPPELAGSADFCWSSCALEHLGSIARGLEFIEASVRCLRPGGIAVHTTEWNPDPGPTLDHHQTVLFQAHHIETLRAALAPSGVDVLPVASAAGDPFLDGYVDVPPYPEPAALGRDLSVLHLRLAIGAFRTTSVGIVCRRRA